MNRWVITAFIIYLIGGTLTEKFLRTVHNTLWPTDYILIVLWPFLWCALLITVGVDRLFTNEDPDQ